MVFGTKNGLLKKCACTYVNVLHLAPILVQLDYVEGRRLSRAHVKNKQRGLIEEAESIEEKEPNLSQAQEAELERQVSKFTKATLLEK